MGITTQTVNVDLNTGKIVPVVYVHQNDTDREIRFCVFNNELPFPLGGRTVKFAYRSPKRNGSFTIISGDSMAEGTVNDSTVVLAVPSEYTLISGIGVLTMIISDNGETVRPVNLKFVVQESADGIEAMEQANDFPSAWFDANIYGWLSENIGGVFTEEQFADAIDGWLAEHPEATTTVTDGSITYNKMSSDVRINDWKTGTNERLGKYGYWYVDGINGNDDNDGKTSSNAFKTIARAFEEARKGDIEIRISVAGSQTYDLASVNFTALCIHFQVHGTGTATIHLSNSGTKVAFYHCHVNFQGTASNPFVITGEDFYFDSGAAQFAYTTINQNVISYGASVRCQNSNLHGQVTIYNCGAMFDSCEVSSISGTASSVYFNACTFLTSLTVDETDRIVQLTNCVSSVVGSTNTLDLSNSDKVFTFFKLFGGELYWRGGFSSVTGSGATPSVGISANTASVHVRQDYFSWLENTFQTGIDLQYNARCDNHLREVWSGTGGLGTFTASEPIRKGHTYQISYKANTGASIVDTFTMGEGTCRTFLKTVYGSGSINIKVIELEFVDGSDSFRISSNRAYYIPTSGSATVTTYDDITSLENNSFISAIYEVY